jgi:hypothetical protein
MDDKALLEAAARAAGDAFEWGLDWHDKGAPLVDGRDWYPLDDDGDALRLAVKLKLNIGFGSERLQGSHWDHVEAFAEPDEDGRSFCPSEEMGGNPYAAVRRVIVRAAAALSNLESKT